MKEIVPFLIQGVAMSVDEFYCHRRRTLRKWERIGHPIDTVSFISALSLTLIMDPSTGALYAYAALSTLSCLLITKDEWQHKELCTGFENWLHSLLFVIHPVVFIWAGYLWWTGSDWLKLAVGSTVALASLFLVYQIVYWNFLQKPISTSGN